MTKTNLTSQNGRSMVEMLGVLAIIGVLSVTGIAGYSAAMRKYRANVLLNQASIAAADIAGQIASGSTDLDLSGHNASQDFGSVTDVKGPDAFTDYQAGDDQFTLIMEDVDEEICTLMQNQLGQRSVVRGVLCDDGKAILTFNKDLSNKPIASDFDEDKEGCEANGHKYCDNDTCIPSSEECPVTGPTCPTGSSTEGTGGSTGIKIDGVLCQCDDENAVYTSNGCEVRTSDTCTDHTSNQCGLGYYCQFSPTDCYDSDRGDGVCTVIKEDKQTTGAVKHWVGPNLDWWSSNSWCLGKGSKLVGYSTLQTEYACNKNNALSTCDWEKMAKEIPVSNGVWLIDGAYCTRWAADISNELFSDGCNADVYFLFSPLCE